MSGRPDVNLLSIANETNVSYRQVGALVADPAVHSDALKFSNSHDGYVRVDSIDGGREDCIDVNNRCSSLEIHVHNGMRPKGKYAATIKGGSRNIVLVGTLENHAAEVDIDIGNQSSQSDELTDDVLLNVAMRDGSPVRVRVWNAEMPMLTTNKGKRYEFVFPSQLPLWARRALYFGYKALKKVKVVE